MKLIKPSFKIIEQQPELEGVYKQIEMAGRTCYKSEDRITETSAKEFVDRMVKSGHGAMLEHGTVYLEIAEERETDLIDFFKTNKYSTVNYHDGLGYYFITTNMRVLVEHFAPEYLEDILNDFYCGPTEHHEKRVTVKFICDRGVSHEFVRHRVFSFAQESTRYCNYSKDKFGNELTFILPCWMDELQVGSFNPVEIVEQAQNVNEFDCTNKELSEIYFMECLAKAELNYDSLIRLGWKPQQARAILPNALKTELVMTGFVSDWKHFFKLRDAGSAHPQARELAQPLHKLFIDKKWLD